MPGDPLAGYLLAAGAASAPGRSVALLMVSSLLLYAGGLLLNDLVDMEVDRRERPRRPLPSGAVDVVVVRRVAVILMFLGVVVALPVGRLAFTVAVVLAAAVFSYNLWTKWHVLLGPVNMGLCRSLSLVLGATAVGHATQVLLAASIGITVYVASVTYLARRETLHGPTGWARWIPALALLALTANVVRVSVAEGPMAARMAATFFFTVVVAALGAWQAPDRRDLSRNIGLMLSALLGLQSALCLASGAGAWGTAAALVLLLLWPLNRLMAARVAAS